MLRNAPVGIVGYAPPKPPSPDPRIQRVDRKRKPLFVLTFAQHLRLNRRIIVFCWPFAGPILRWRHRRCLQRIDALERQLFPEWFPQPVISPPPARKQRVVSAKAAAEKWNKSYNDKLNSRKLNSIDRNLTDIRMATSLLEMNHGRACQACGAVDLRFDISGHQPAIDGRVLVVRCDACRMTYQHAVKYLNARHPNLDAIIRDFVLANTQPASDIPPPLVAHSLRAR